MFVDKSIGLGSSHHVLNKISTNMWGVMDVGLIDVAHPAPKELGLPVCRTGGSIGGSIPMQKLKSDYGKGSVLT